MCGAPGPPKCDPKTVLTHGHFIQRTPFYPTEAMSCSLQGWPWISSRRTAAGAPGLPAPTPRPTAVSAGPFGRNLAFWDPLAFWLTAKRGLPKNPGKTEKKERDKKKKKTKKKRKYKPSDCPVSLFNNFKGGRATSYTHLPHRRTKQLLGRLFFWCTPKKNTHTHTHQPAREWATKTATA